MKEFITAALNFYPPDQMDYVTVAWNHQFSLVS